MRDVSTIHATLYSIIAIQQMNLAHFYPSIFWNTARLMVESSSIDFISEDLELLADDNQEDRDEEEKIKTKSVNYFKMSAALGKVQDFGVKINPPNINKSNFTFSPNVDENTIYFGFMGVSRINANLIYNIIQNRPYKSLKDFLNKVKVNKIQATMLIKSGAFDDFGERELLLYEYCDSVADKKETLNLRNMARIVELGLIPKSLEKEEIIYKVNNFLKKSSRYGDILIITDGVRPYINDMPFNEIKYDEDGVEYIEVVDWEKFYKKAMNPIRAWIKKDLESLLKRVNNAAVKELTDKYSKGNKASQEMEALSYYYSYHELQTQDYQDWFEEIGVSNFYDLPEEPFIEWQNERGAKKFYLSTIVGTSIGRDKTKGIVGFLTPQGYVTVKIYKSTFTKYDKQVKEEGVTEKSWFTKGSKLLIQGYRIGETFILKTYKGMNQPLYQIIGVGKLKSKRLGE